MFCSLVYVVNIIRSQLNAFYKTYWLINETINHIYFAYVLCLLCPLMGFVTSILFWIWVIFLRMSITFKMEKFNWNNIFMWWTIKIRVLLRGKRCEYYFLNGCRIYDRVDLYDIFGVIFIAKLTFPKLKNLLNSQFVWFLLIIDYKS